MHAILPNRRFATTALGVLAVLLFIYEWCKCQQDNAVAAVRSSRSVSMERADGVKESVSLPHEWSWHDVSAEDAEHLGILPGSYASIPENQHRSGWCGACYLLAVVHMLTDRWNIEIGRRAKANSTALTVMKPFVQVDAQAMLDEYDAVRSVSSDDQSWNACKGGSPVHVLSSIKRQLMKIHVSHPSGYAWTGFPRQRAETSNTNTRRRTDGLVFLQDDEMGAARGDETCEMRVIDVTTPSNRTETIKHEIYHNGPVVLGIDAECLIGGNKHGIASTRSKAHRNHAVSVIGWRKVGKHDYWIVRNTWGDRIPENLPKDMSCVKPGSNDCKPKWQTWHSLPDMPGFALVSQAYIETKSADAKASRETPWYSCRTSFEQPRNEVAWQDAPENL